MSNEHMEEGMSVQPRLYELGYLLAPLIASESVEGEVARIKAILGTEVKAEGAPAMQKLAYTISKNIGTNKHDFDDAYFGWIKFEATPEQMSTIKYELDKLEMIVRYLLIKTEIAEEVVVPTEELAGEEVLKEVAKEVAPAVDVVEKKEETREAQIDKDIDDLLKREQL